MVCPLYGRIGYPESQVCDYLCAFGEFVRSGFHGLYTCETQENSVFLVDGSSSEGYSFVDGSQEHDYKERPIRNVWPLVNVFRLDYMG